MSKTNCKRRKYVSPQCKVMLVEIDDSVLSASGNRSNSVSGVNWSQGEDEDLMEMEEEKWDVFADKEGLWTDED